MSGAYTRSWRTLVEPGSSILAEEITSGSFDVFGQLENHLRVHVDVNGDEPDMLAIGVVDAPFLNYTFRAHTEFFHEPIAASEGIVLTRLTASDGRRLGSTVIDTHDHAELHGLRAVPGGFALVGSVLSEVRSNGSGWDAFIAFVTHDGAPGSYRVLDFDRGDVLFDVAALPSGRYLAFGATGYTQNPSGASISEDAQPLSVLLNTDGSLGQNLGYTAGARQNQLTTIAPLNGSWLLGGMVNGPGTHWGDADPKLIVADGFVREETDLPGQGTTYRVTVNLPPSKDGVRHPPTDAGQCIDSPITVHPCNPRGLYSPERGRTPAVGPPRQNSLIHETVTMCGAFSGAYVTVICVNKVGYASMVPLCLSCQAFWEAERI
jgi:hypothetical protein